MEVHFSSCKSEEEKNLKLLKTWNKISRKTLYY